MNWHLQRDLRGVARRLSIYSGQKERNRYMSGEGSDEVRKLSEGAHAVLHRFRDEILANHKNIPNGFCETGPGKLLAPYRLHRDIPLIQ